MRGAVFGDCLEAGEGRVRMVARKLALLRARAVRRPSRGHERAEQASRLFSEVGKEREGRGRSGIGRRRWDS